MMGSRPYSPAYLLNKLRYGLQAWNGEFGFSRASVRDMRIRSDTWKSGGFQPPSELIPQSRKLTLPLGPVVLVTFFVAPLLGHSELVTWVTPPLVLLDPPPVLDLDVLAGFLLDVVDVLSLAALAAGLT